MTKPIATSVDSARVSVVGHQDDEDVCLPLGAALQRAGARVHLGDWSPGDVAIVVVLSPALLASGIPLPDPELMPDTRLVPVTIGGINDDDVPEALRELNWIQWSPTHRDAVAQQVVSACHTDLADYRASQALLARATGWQLAGQRAGDLITNRKQFRSAAAAVEKDAGTAASHLVQAYLQASSAATRQQTWRAITATAVRVGLVAALAFFGWIVVRDARYVAERSGLELVASADETSLIPHGEAVQLAALIALRVEHGDPVPAHVTQRLTHYLSEPWPHARFSLSPNRMFVNDIAIAEDGSVVYLDGGGAVWRSSVTNASGTKVNQLMDSPAYKFAASEDWSVFAASDGNRVVTDTPRGVQTVQLPQHEEIQQLLLNDTGSRLLVVLSDSARLLDLTQPTLTEGALVANALAVNWVGSTPTALIRDKGLRLVDVETGVVKASFPDPIGQFDDAALSTEGTFVVHGDDGYLHASRGGALERTAVILRQPLASLAITPRDEVLYTGFGANATKVHDLIRDLPLADVCRESSAQDIRLSPDGTWVVCRYGAEQYVWNLDDVRPTALEREAVPAEQAVDGELRASIDDDGVLTLAQGEQEMRWDVTAARATASTLPAARSTLSGRPTALALAGPTRTLAVASSTGEVLVVELHQRGEFVAVARWASPDGSAVRGIALQADRALVTTTTGSWSFPVCTGCSTQGPERLLEEVHKRRLNCYHQMEPIVPRRIVERLGLERCVAG